MRHDLHSLFTLSGAVIRQLSDVVELEGSILDTNSCSTYVRWIKVLGISLRNCESSTSFDEADHVDFLLAVSSDREAGNTDIELRAKRRNDCRKFSVLCGRAFQAHDMRDRIGHIDVITGGGGAI